MPTETEYLKIQALDMLQNGCFAIANQLLNQALALKPQDAATLHLLGFSACQTNQPQLALHYLNQAIRLPGALAQFYDTLGMAYMALGQSPAAIQAYQAAIGSGYREASCYQHLGNAYLINQQVDQARANYRQALAIAPQSADALYNLAVTYDFERMRQDAIPLYEKAIQANPAMASAYFNLANLYHFEGRIPESIELFEKGITFNPFDIQALNNLGYAYLDNAQYDQARATFHDIIERTPDYADAGANRAIVDLLLGHAQAWRQFSQYKSTQRVAWRTFNTPPWQGEPLKGKRILLIAHSGFGDTFQYLRYVPQLKKMGETVVFECEPALMTLMAGHTQIDTVVERGSAQAQDIAYDTWTYLVCLPGWLNVTWDTVPPADKGLIIPKATLDKWRQRLTKEPGFKIGIAWSGDPSHVKFDNRACQLKDFSAFAKIPNVRFYGLQLGPGSEQNQAPPAGIAYEDLGPDIVDFADTAAILTTIDLVITVDTAIGHLAGTLGKPVYLLVPFVPDYRWMLERNDTPWYSNTRLFRQNTDKTWAPVFKLIQKPLKELIKKAKT